jgi:hypothetical protein
MSETSPHGSIEDDRQFRKKLAETLRSLPKGERITHLENVKNQDDSYRSAKQLSIYERLMHINQQRVDAVSKNVNSIEELSSEIDTLPSSCAVEGILHGHYSKENMQLQVKLATYFNCPNLVFFSAVARDKIKSFLETSGAVINEEVKKSEYATYLKKQFPELNLTREEAQRIIEKLPLEIYVSIDEGMHESLLLLNALDDVVTYSCCSGHDLGPTNRMYLLFTTKDSEMIRIIRQTNSSTHFMTQFDYERFGNLTARSPYDSRDVPFEESEKGWALVSLRMPPNKVEAERFALMSQLQREQERDAFKSFIKSIALQRRAVKA